MMLTIEMIQIMIMVLLEMLLVLKTEDSDLCQVSMNHIIDDDANDDDKNDFLQVPATGTVKHPSVRETARMATMSAGGMTAEMVT